MRANSAMCGLGVWLIGVASVAADDSKAPPVSLHIRPRVARATAPDPQPDGNPPPAAGAPTTAGPPGATSAAQPPEATDTPTRIAVTGSRIERDTRITPAPLTVLSREDLEAYGRSTLGDILQQLPMQTSATDAQVNNLGVQIDDGTGSLGVDLRGLGANRTLILVNGRAVVPDGTGVADVSMIPLTAIERVEIVKAGASAVYGSGAIGGVVNVITRTDFDGTEAALYVGDSQRNDGVTYDASFLTGHHTEDRRGRIVLSAGIQHQDPVFARDRSFSSRDMGFLPELASSLQARSSRYTVYSAGSYELRPEISGFFEASYLYRRAQDQLEPEPSVAPGTGILISKDSIYNPLGMDVIDFRAHGLLGPRRTTRRADLFRIVGGLRGTVPDDAPLLASWAWELSYDYGRSHVATDQTGELVPGRIAAAVGPSFLDASGMPICGTPVAPIAGCVPLDLLGRSITPAALDYLTFNGTLDEHSTQHTVLATTHGRIAALPNHGELLAAVGADVREETDQIPIDPLLSTVDTADPDPAHGSYHVLEGFGELSLVPIRGTAVVDRVELDLAARGFRSSAFGSGASWSAGGLFRTFGGLSVRGTYATTYRTPTVAELFQRRSDRLVSFQDPCDTHPPSSPNPITLDPMTARECSREMVPPNAAFGSSQQRMLGGGNPGLEAEAANVLTAGLVLEPPWIQGLELAVDYWSVDLSKAVQQDSFEGILSSCYEFGVRSYCDRIHRDPAQGSAIDAIDLSLANTGSVSVSGIDVAAAYDHDFGELGRVHEQFEARFQPSYELDSVLQVHTPMLAGLDRDRLYPDLKAIWSSSWSHASGLAAGFILRYVGGFQLYREVLDRAITSNIDASYELDVHGSYRFDEWPGRPTVVAGVNNVLDSEPPVPYVAGQSGLSESPHDVVGRFFYLKLSSRF